MEVSVVAESTAGCGSVGVGTQSKSMFSKNCLPEAFPRWSLQFGYGFTSAFSASDAPSGENLSYQWWLEESSGESTEIPGAVDLSGFSPSLTSTSNLAISHTPARMVVGPYGPSLHKLKSYRNCKHRKLRARVRLKRFCMLIQRPAISNALPATGGTESFQYGWQIQNSLIDWTTCFHQPRLLHVWYHDGNNLCPLGG